ncbi:MAG: protein translocase subunit SecD [Phycisphaerales bacterium]|nr:protein translocase subunit SecD [Phycisphaerales bacterium]
MNNLVSKILLILFVVGLCLWSVYPPESKIRLGKDLQGGVSLVYSVNIPDGVDAESILAQVIDVLKQRVNPQGVLDISMQPVGRDRIEVVMPLPNEKVQALQKEFRTQLDTLLSKSRISPAELEQALVAGNAVERFGGTGTRGRDVIELQDQYSLAKSTRTSLDAARAEGDAAKISGLEDTLARAEIREEDLRSKLFSQTLPESTLLEALALPNTPVSQKDANGKLVLDDDGNVVKGPSERAATFAILETDYPHLAENLEKVRSAYAAYEVDRTGLDDPEDLKRLLRGAGVLEFHIAVGPTANDVPITLLREQLAERGPNNTDSAVARWYEINDLGQWYDSDDESQLARLKANPATFFAQRPSPLVAAEKDDRYYLLLYDSPAKSMTHDGGSKWAIERATRQVDDLGRPAVGFNLDTSGGSFMRKLTAPHVNQPMAIVLDGEVYTAPNLNSAIGSSGIIQGSFSESEIKYLIRVLAAGSLEARMSPEPISMSVLGPSIGQDNLSRGLWAVGYSVIAVAIIMLCYYFLAGLVADLALLMNGIMIFGIMAMIDGTFTLPGLAGIALTVGMAVDANVLVFERIREELVNHQEDLRTSIRLGFAKAASAILDGNITNLIVCFILYQTAATEVKGFALTLSIGVLATLFTTLFVARVIFTVYVEVFKARSLPMLPMVVPAIHRLLEPKINWIAFRTPLLIGSAVLAVACMVLFFSRGAEVLETEFRGGVSVVMTTRPAVEGEPTGTDGTAIGRLQIPRSEVEQAVRQIGRDNPSDPILAELQNATVLTVGPTTSDGHSSSFQIKVANPVSLGEDENIANKVVEAVVGRFGSELDITRPVRFAGESADEHSGYTHALEQATLGESIERTGAGVPVADFRGGVAVVIDGIDPPVTTADVEQRLRRMRNQPDFGDTAGRDVEVVGLTAADPTAPQDGFTSIAVMVSDELLSSFTVELDTWDRQLAQREFELLQAALTREASLDQVSSFSPRVAQNLAASAIVAVILSLVGMLVYIWFRFGSLRYSLCAIAALMFNVCVCLGAIALSVVIGERTFGSVRLLDEFRIDLNVVAGLLTIVGYSLNDTIVIMDRIRENRGKLSYASSSVVNASINQTFSRTVLTSGTTITSAIILYSLGGTGIRPFAFTFLIGLIAATYSSVAIAAPLTWKKGGGAQPQPGADEQEAGVLPAAEPA